MLHNPFLRCVVYLIILSNTLISCSNNNFNDGKIVIKNIEELPIDTGMHNIRLTRLADSISYVKLAPTQLPVGKIEKVKYIDDKLFILDTRVSRALFAFSTSGKFLYKIDGDKGKKITDFCMDSSHKNLYVYYANKHLVATYSVGSGSLISSLRIPGYFHSIDILGDDVFVLTRDGITKFDDDPRRYNQNRICMFDRYGTYLKGYMNTPIFPYINYGKIYTVSNEEGTAVNISRLYSDTIYIITKSTFEARFNLGIIKKVDLRKFHYAQKTEEADHFVQSGDFSGIWGPFFKTDQNIAFYYACQNRVYLYWKSLNTDSQYNISYFVNDIDGMPDMGTIKQIDKHKAISVLLPLDILNTNRVASMSKANSPNLKLSELANGLTDYSNPVIAIYHLKPASNQILANK